MSQSCSFLTTGGVVCFRGSRDTVWDPCCRAPGRDTSKSAFRAFDAGKSHSQLRTRFPMEKVYSVQNFLPSILLTRSGRDGLLLLTLHDFLAPGHRCPSGPRMGFRGPGSKARCCPSGRRASSLSRPRAALCRPDAELLPTSGTAF